MERFTGRIRPLTVGAGGEVLRYVSPSSRRSYGNACAVKSGAAAFKAMPNESPPRRALIKKGNAKEHEAYNFGSHLLVTDGELLAFNELGLAY